MELIIIKVLVHCVASQFIQGRMQDLIYGGGGNKLFGHLEFLNLW